MTREEAIEYLEIERTDYDIAVYRESPIREALNMAIEALARPVFGNCENCKWSEEVGPSLWLCNCKISQVVGSYTEPDFYCKYWGEK